MNKPNVKKYIIVILAILGVVFLNLTFKSLSNKPVVLDTVKLKEIKVDKKTFGIFIEKNSYSGEDDKYEQYDGDTWPTGYLFNEEKSGCVDVNGLLIDNAINYEDDTISVTTGKTAYCYVYFDKIKARDLSYTNASYTECEDVQCALDELYEKENDSISKLTLGLSDTYEAGLKRYQGLTADNYICFGTTDKDTCTSDTDKYMYRIMGIDANNRMKLIKKEALNTGYAWNNERNTKTLTWVNSDLYNGLNGSYFLTNTNYVPSGWDTRIDTNTWHYGNIKDDTLSLVELTQAEQNFTDTVNAKIGLLYIHDIAYGFKEGKNCSSAGYCKTSWLNLLKNGNDTNPPSTYEWSMTNFDYTLFYYQAWRISGDTFYADTIDVDNELSVRPVFFLNSSQNVASGNGTLTDPFILS